MKVISIEHHSFTYQEIQRNYRAPPYRHLKTIMKSRGTRYHNNGITPTAVYVSEFQNNVSFIRVFNVLGDFNLKFILLDAVVVGERGRTISDVYAGFDRKVKVKLSL
jgi:hypothetical protein